MPNEKPQTVDVVLKGLTKEELMVLYYVVPSSSWGDPLKDIYELERDCQHRIERPTGGKGGVIETLGNKVFKPLRDAIDSLPSNGNKDEDEDE